MKIIIITLILIHTLTLNTIANELKDCSVYSKLSPKYFTCKASNFAKETANYQKKSWSEEKEKINKLKKKVTE
tara:strand:+ start:1758 stop:1976 length:219 start_codon:yes stop_codon:yes gene_type:complete